MAVLLLSLTIAATALAAPANALTKEQRGSIMTISAQTSMLKAAYGGFRKALARAKMPPETAAKGQKAVKDFNLKRKKFLRSLKKPTFSSRIGRFLTALDRAKTDGTISKAEKKKLTRQVHRLRKMATEIRKGVAALYGAGSPLHALTANLVNLTRAVRKTQKKL